jgi:TRAP-type mannitol/chloroaromatic compound transport system permease small subunit
MKGFVKAIGQISEQSGKAVSFLVILLTGVILYEISARYLFKSPTIWAHEVAQMIYGAYVILLGAYAFKKGVHVNVDILYKKFKPRTRAIMDLFTWLLFFFFCGLILVKGWEMASESFQLGETEPTSFAPIVWPIKMTIPLGALLILLQGLAKFIQDLQVAFTGVVPEKEEGHGH